MNDKRTVLTNSNIMCLMIVIIKKIQPVYFTILKVWKEKLIKQLIEGGYNDVYLEICECSL